MSKPVKNREVSATAPDDVVRRLAEAERELADERRRRVEAEKTAAHLSEALDGMAQGLAYYDADDRLVYYNQQYLDTLPNLAPTIKLGMTFEEILRAGVSRGYVLEAEGREEDYIAERIDRRLSSSGAFDFLQKSGNWIRVDEKRSPTGGIVATRTDITDRKAVEAALTESNTRLAGVIENLPAAVVFENRAGEYLIANRVFRDWYGATGDDIIGRRQADYFTPEEAAYYRGLDQSVLNDGEIVGSGTIHHDLTDRQRATQILHAAHDELERQVEDRTQDITESENLLRTIIDTVPGTIDVKDLNFRYVLRNRYHAQYFGHDDAPTDGARAADLYPSDAAESLENWDRQVIETGEPSPLIDTPLVNAAGEFRIYTDRKVPLFDHSGKIKGVVTFGMDTTDQKQTERALQENERLFRGMFENSPIPTALVGAGDDRRYIRVNKAYCDFLGYTKDELADMSANDVTHPDEQTQSLENRVAVASGQLSRIQRVKRYLRKDGRTVWGELSFSAIHDDAGAPLYTLSQIRDLTAERLAQNTLLDAIETIPDGVALFDADERLVICNSAYRRGRDDSDAIFTPGTRYEDIVRDFFERGLAELFGKTVDEAVHERMMHHRNRDQAHELKTIEGRWTRTIEYRTSDGSTLIVRADITDEKALQQSLRDNQERFRVISENSPVALFMIRAESGEVLDCNPAACMLLGMPKDDLIGEKMAQFYQHPEERDTVVANQLRAGHFDNFEWHFRSHDGRDGVALVSGRVANFGGEQVLLSAVADSTDKLDSERELIAAKEEAEAASRAKSLFLSSMSHELRTPLNAILGFTQVMQYNDKEPLSEWQNECVTHVLESGEHLLGLIEKVLELNTIEAGQMVLHWDEASPAALIGESVAMVSERARKSDVSLDVAVPRAPPTLWTDAGRLKQILVNYLTNAIKYNRPGGDVRISVADEIDGRGRLRFRVSDTGLGIPAASQDDLFEAFNRLGKEAGSVEGTGIGLYITKQIADAIGAGIGFESVEGEGSTFWVDVPTQGSMPSARRPVASPSADN